MIGMHYNSNNLQDRGGVGGFASSILASSVYPPEVKRKKDGIFTTNEPISVLDTRSPSPSTSTSTFSSFNNNNPQGNMVVNGPTSTAAGGGGKEEWVADLQPPVHNANLGLEEWENLSESAGKQSEILKLLLQAGIQNEIQGIVGFGGIYKSSELTSGSAIAPYGNVLPSYNTSALGLSGSGFPLNEQKVKIGLDSNSLLINNNGDALHCLAPYIALQADLEVQNAANPNMMNLNPLFFGTEQMQQKQVVYDQVYKAAELIQAGNFSNAQGILARLNHFLAPNGKPFLRSAFYIKEALELAFLMSTNQIASVPSAPFDVMFKMGAYKVFSEVSPVIQFMNFTANQILLEALVDYQQLHIIDFDIGFGAHWSSFLQELPNKNQGVTSVKITAFASPSTHHPLEISLMHENLTQFANCLGINLELEVVNIDSFDPKDCNSVASLRSSEGEAIAVNFPIWSLASYLNLLPSYLCLIKKLSPKIVVSMGRGCERIDLPFSSHILHTLEYYEALLDSVDDANYLTCDACNKIDKFLIQPRIESTVLGRLVFPNILPPWRNLFASVGYLPVSISNFAETQAQCVLKRMQVRGFHVERQQHSSLLLCWKSCELLSISAWSC